MKNQPSPGVCTRLLGAGGHCLMAHPCTCAHVLGIHLLTEILAGTRTLLPEAWKLSYTGLPNIRHSLAFGGNRWGACCAYLIDNILLRLAAAAPCLLPTILPTVAFCLILGQQAAEGPLHPLVCHGQSMVSSWLKCGACRLQSWCSSSQLVGFC